MFRVLTVAALAATLAGCTALSTPYQRAEMPAGPGWSSERNAKAVAADPWWRALGSRDLDSLIMVAARDNNDILLAALRAHRARLQAGLVEVGTLPRLEGSVSTSRTSPLDSARDNRAQSTASIGLSYELDLWGKLAAQRDIASFEAHATAEDYQAARLATIGQTIELYFRLAHANESLALAEASLQSARRVETIIGAQAAQGAVSDLEKNEGRQNVEMQAARIPDLVQQRLVLRNALIVLLNGKQSPVAEPQRLPGRGLPQISPGLPANLIARRPDLRAAELRLRASLRGTDLSKARFYPAISLTGSLGTSSTQLLSFLSNPVATLGGNMALAFLNLNEMKFSIAVSKAQFEEAAVSFRGNVLTALSEVANALGARRAASERMARLTRALEAARTVESLSEARYRAGAVPLRTWLDAQERRRSVEVSLVDTRLARLLAEATLYRALGGEPGPTPDGK
ncbi:efflux transporter outer membrane subunit [Rhizobium sp. C4]|uniref:efflux transporter outer membrane subunit n=1 Tax=Rhizobium sp. C4 TaxID=1349800 RepID=UPI001E4ACCBB|nr:efflux transporter outer membrane subunit [Rhizobium sp. C4]MCD2174414.1 efflux transporter outer membrane subunit [Rhizobium sp. C4]